MENEIKRATPDKVGPKPTLKTISQLSGLAVPTVSRALSDAPDIGQKTKERVRQIAKEVGYVPNWAGVRLRTGRTNVISLVLPIEHDLMNHTARLISSIAAGLKETQFHLNVTPHYPDDDVLRPFRYIVETGSADAVIFNQIEEDDPRVAYLRERGFPFATHGRSKWAEQHSYYDFDNAVFGRIAVEHLARRCRKRLLLIAPPVTQNYGRETIEGAQSAALECGVMLTLAKGIDSDNSYDDVSAYVAQAVTQDPLIDGIISGSTTATMAAVAGMEAEGFDVATDIDVFSKEPMPFLKLFRKGIIVIPEDVKHAGEFLARAAIQAVREPNAPPMQGLEVPKHPKD
ncbi:LacI family transcriptional regulator [Octadecabacter sp. R77987]|uniref:LacI family transcriptional regulator n=1 Tax=Octadecabacter sp. R77987 TaxID=3093874 RepID=UPI00366CB6FE